MGFLVLGLIIHILAVFVCAEGSLPSTFALYNTSVTCLHGSAPPLFLKVDCDVFQKFSLVVIHRVLHGLTPLSGGCSLTSSTEACCPPRLDPTRDCVFFSEAETEKLRKTCDGNIDCSVAELRRVPVGDSCSEKGGHGLSYDTDSYFTLVEFGCVNSDLLTDVCGSNVTMSGQTLYLDSNFYPTNSRTVDANCSCVVLTTCQQQLIFEVLKVDLNTNLTDQTCRETVALTEGASGTILATLNCSSSSTQPTTTPGGGGGGAREGGGGAWPRFQSVSNVVGLNLQSSGRHTGKLLLRVTATQGGPVEVLCGQAGSRVLLDENQCGSTLTTVTPKPDLSSPTFNTTKEACLDGLGGGLLTSDFEISCLGKSGAGLISVDRLFHGVTPRSMGCDLNAEKSRCCPGFKPSRDCLFTTSEGLAALRKSCDGYLACSPRLTSASVPPGGCPPRVEGNLTYRSYSSFAFVEYSCINVGLMSGICDAGNTVRSREVYLESNVYTKNGHRAGPGRCSCVASTACGQRLLFYPMILDLSSNRTGDDACLDEVSLLDANVSSVKLDIDCGSNKIDEVPSQKRSVLFQSQTQVVNLTLRHRGANKGRVLFKVLASGGALVELRCGRTTEVPLWDQHRCAPPNDTGTTPTPSPHTTPSATSTPTTERGSSPPEGADRSVDDDRETIIAIVAAVVALIIVVVFIIIIIIICRGRRSGSEPVVMDDMNVYYEPNIYETVTEGSDEIGCFDIRTYDNVTLPVTNGDVNNEKHVYATAHDGNEMLEGAVGGIGNPVYTANYDMDNVLNESNPVYTANYDMDNVLNESNPVYTANYDMDNVLNESKLVVKK